MDKMQAIVAVIQALAWPATLFLILYFLKGEVFQWLGGRGVTLKNQTLGMEIVIGALQKEISLTSTEKKEISNLSAHDIWALETFNSQPFSKYNMSSAHRVIAKTFLEAGLVEFQQDKLMVTDKGRKILDIANNILK